MYQLSHSITFIGKPRSLNFEKKYKLNENKYLSINTDFCTKCNIAEYHSECRARKERG